MAKPMSAAAVAHGLRRSFDQVITCPEYAADGTRRHPPRRRFGRSGRPVPLGFAEGLPMLQSHKLPLSRTGLLSSGRGSTQSGSSYRFWGQDRLVGSAMLHNTDEGVISVSRAKGIPVPPLPRDQALPQLGGDDQDPGSGLTPIRQIDAPRRQRTKHMRPLRYKVAR